MIIYNITSQLDLVSETFNKSDISLAQLKCESKALNESHNIYRGKAKFFPQQVV